MGTAQVNVMGAYFIVVKDMSVIRQIEEYRNSLAKEDESIAVAYIEESYGFDLNCKDEKQIDIYNTILERIGALTASDGVGADGVQMTVDYPHYYIDSKAGGRADTIAINGGLFFLGVMLGAVFLFGTILIMYYNRFRKDMKIRIVLIS